MTPQRPSKTPYPASHPWLLAGLWALVGTTVALLTTRRINLATADLGRHIANGRWLFSHPELLTTNFYSYTNPQAPFINHHWLSGLVFYWIHELAGFTGLSLFYGAAVSGAFALLARAAVRFAGHGPALTLGALVAPLVAYRTEIRPEGFSLLLAAGFYALLSRVQRDPARQRRWLLALPVLMVAWVNLHIYFFFGLLILGAFVVEAANDWWQAAPGTPREQAAAALRDLLMVSLGAAAATFVSPFGWRLAFYPFLIFDNYGYMIVENQSLAFFYQRGMSFPVFIPLYLALGLFWALLALQGLRWAFKRGRVPVATLSLALVFSVMAVTAIRNITLFGAFVLPALAYLWSVGARRRTRPLALAAAIGCALYSYGQGMLPTLVQTTGLGLEPGALGALDFFRAQHLRGPLFNNYDIGGYLIYGLFPATPVFVDNRPEAYPAAFFTETYVPMQEDERAWQAEDSRYQFNAIIFHWHDYTPAGQNFLHHRIPDPDWAAVYVDDQALILLRRNAANAEVIQQYEIPKDRFAFHP